MPPDHLLWINGLILVTAIFVNGWDATMPLGELVWVIGLILVVAIITTASYFASTAHNRHERWRIKQRDEEAQRQRDHELMMELGRPDEWKTTRRPKKSQW